MLTDAVGSDLLQERGALPRAQDVGIPAASSDWLFRKAPLYLTEAVGSVTLTVPDDGKQFLLWVPSEAWVGAGAQVDDKRPWVTARLTASGCSDSVVGFFGGLLTLDPQHCFPLTIDQEHMPEQRLMIRGAGGSCP